MKSVNPPSRVPTRHSRDAGLRRLARANRWLIAGSALLTGVLTDVAAQAFPGHKAPSRREGAARAADRAHAHHALRAPSATPKAATRQTTQTAPAPAETQTETQAPAPAEVEQAPAPVEEAHTATPEAATQPPPAETHEEAPAPAPEPAPEAPVVSGGS